MNSELLGYADRLSVAPGECIRFMISTDQPEYEANIVRLIHADENPAGPGFKQKAMNSAVDSTYPGRKQKAQTGSFVVVPFHEVIQQLTSFTIQAWIYPTTPRKHEAQGLITRWCQDHGLGLFVSPEGDLQMWIGQDADHVVRIGTDTPMRASDWYFVAATYDAKNHDLSIYQWPTSNWPREDSAATIHQATQFEAPTPFQAPIVIGAAGSIDVLLATQHHFNGKIDRPTLFSRSLTESELAELARDGSPQEIAPDALVAAWDFACDVATSRIVDIGPHGLHGLAVNMPMRAVTGHNWQGQEFNFQHAPSEYRAIHFHDDDLEDACWQVDFTLTVSDHWRSGFYAVHLKAGDVEDHVPFFVRPPRDSSTAKILLLVPTMPYVAYANQTTNGMHCHDSGATGRQMSVDPLDQILSDHPELGISIYDTHTDGSGCCHSSYLRPMLNMRPKYKSWIVGGPRHLAGDLYLVDWLEAKGFEYDVVTDHDLHQEEAELLKRYQVVLTGTHPEYWTAPMRRGMEQYLQDGGRLMYLGGNGFYWVTSATSKTPHVLEVRRGMSASRDWTSRPGECYHSTGELGGLWRHRGMAPNQLVGVGLTAMGWHGAGHYRRRPASRDPKAAFIFEGIGEDEVIGNFGLSLGGAAGDEIDRLDFALGTPAHAMSLASSEGHPRHTYPVLEDQPQINSALLSGHFPNLCADIVYFETPRNGAVFSTGSITWCGSLSHNQYDNNISRMTENVLRRFMDT